jgi:hypothetical protein
MRVGDWILETFFRTQLEQYMHPKVSALQTRVNQLEGQVAAGVIDWNGLKGKYDEAVVRVGQLEQQIANQPAPTGGLAPDDEAALDAMGATIAEIEQLVADARTVNSPAN